MSKASVEEAPQLDDSLNKCKVEAQISKTNKQLLMIEEEKDEPDSTPKDFNEKSEAQ